MLQFEAEDRATEHEFGTFSWSIAGGDSPAEAQVTLSNSLNQEAVEAFAYPQHPIQEAPVLPIAEVPLQDATPIFAAGYVAAGSSTPPAPATIVFAAMSAITDAFILQLASSISTTMCAYGWMEYQWRTDGCMSVVL